eukprot:4337227-Prymnesium_polylepis.1
MVQQNAPACAALSRPMVGALEPRSSIEIVSLYDERIDAARPEEERRAQELANQDPPSSDLADVLEAMRDRQYLRQFNPPSALLKPYCTAYDKACEGVEAEGESDLSKATFWKTGKGCENRQMPKDVKAVAHHARMLACEKQGGKWDVVVFQIQGSNYIGMTPFGFECWQRVLKHVRSRTAIRAHPPIAEL